MKDNRPALWLLGLMSAVTVWLSLTPVEPYQRLLPGFLSWDKAEHFLLYFVLATLARAGSRSRRQWVALLLGAEILGGVLELAQHFTPGRLPEWGDFAANSLGIAASSLLAFSWWRIPRHASQATSS